MLSLFFRAVLPKSQLLWPREAIICDGRNLGGHADEYPTLHPFWNTMSYLL